jgi:hypothetical protein
MHIPGCGLIMHACMPDVAGSCPVQLRWMLNAMSMCLSYTVYGSASVMPAAAEVCCRRVGTLAGIQPIRLCEPPAAAAHIQHTDLHASAEPPAAAAHIQHTDLHASAEVNML